MDLATSSGLAFASGINAYLPLLSLGINAYLPLLSLAIAADLWPGYYYINPQFAFLSQGWCIALLALLTLL